MNRREFLRLLAASSGCAYLGRPAAYAAEGRLANPPLVFHVQAGGGWDQALFCDPKPALRASFASRLYADGGDVRMAGRIPYLSFADFGKGGASGFFGKYFDRMLVINGIDTETNNHEVGLRYSCSGSINSSMPCFAAQVAGVYRDGRALSFIDGGQSFSNPAGLVPVTKVPGGSLRTMSRLIRYKWSDAAPFIDGQLDPLIRDAQIARLQRLSAGASLPRVKAQVDAQLGARSLQDTIAGIAVPGVFTPPAGSDLTDPRVRLINFAYNAYAAGHCVAVNMAFMGFDSHTDNESEQAIGLRALFAHVGYILDKAENDGVPVLVVCSSDFGRTTYRTGTGTDHWPASSALILQSTRMSSTSRLPTNLVIGGTDADLRPFRIHPDTLQEDPTGVLLRPGHLFSALRRATGIAEAAALAPFPIQVDRELSIG